MKLDPQAHLLVWLLLSLAVLRLSLPLALIIVLLLIGLGLWRRGGWALVGRSLRMAGLLSLGVGLSLAWQSSGLSALITVLRLNGLIGLSQLLLQCLDAFQLADALLAHGWRPQLVLVLTGPLQWLPFVQRELAATWMLQSSRGVRLDGWRWLKNGPVLLIPLVISILNAADALTESLESRGFASPQRTSSASYRWTWRDWLAVSGAAACVWIGGRL